MTKRAKAAIPANKTRPMSFRYVPVDRERWQSQAEACGISLSEWIQRRLNDAGLAQAVREELDSFYPGLRSFRTPPHPHRPFHKDSGGGLPGDEHPVSEFFGQNFGEKMGEETGGVESGAGEDGESMASASRKTGLGVWGQGQVGAENEVWIERVGQGLDRLIAGCEFTAEEGRVLVERVMMRVRQSEWVSLDRDAVESRRLVQSYLGNAGGQLTPDDILAVQRFSGWFSAKAASGGLQAIPDEQNGTVIAHSDALVSQAVEREVSGGHSENGSGSTGDDGGTGVAGGDVGRAGVKAPGVGRYGFADRAEELGSVGSSGSADAAGGSADGAGSAGGVGSASEVRVQDPADHHGEGAVRDSIHPAGVPRADADVAVEEEEDLELASAARKVAADREAEAAAKRKAALPPKKLQVTKPVPKPAKKPEKVSKICQHNFTRGACPRGCK